MIEDEENGTVHAATKFNGLIQISSSFIYSLYYTHKVGIFETEL